VQTKRTTNWQYNSNNPNKW